MYYMWNEEADEDIYLKRQIQLKRPWCHLTPLWQSMLLLQWWEAQRSWPNLSHQWPAPGPDSDPPAGYRHPAECFREGAAHGGKRTNTSAGQSSGVPHTVWCQYTVSQLQRGIDTFPQYCHGWKLALANTHTVPAACHKLLQLLIKSYPYTRHRTTL